MLLYDNYLKVIDNKNNSENADGYQCHQYYTTIIVL